MTPEEVLAGYRDGMFPMSGVVPGMITWHRPRRRAVIPLDRFHVSRSLARRMRHGGFQVTSDADFPGVMRACAARPETWISDKFLAVYGELNRLGRAHSVEVWVDGELAGGLYGVHLGGAFFAESKFHRVTDMSKVALTSLVRHLAAQGFELLEVQYMTPHLFQFGTIELKDKDYRQILASALSRECQWGTLRVE